MDQMAQEGLFYLEDNNGISACYNEGRSKSFAIQYDVQMAQTKQLHYFSM